MLGRAFVKIAPRQDVCIFCAFRMGRAPQPIRRHFPSQDRMYRTSTRSNRPPAAAYAVAEDEPDESPQSFRQPTPPPPKSSPSAWPTFVPRTPIPKAVEAATRPPENKPAATEPSNWKCSSCGNVNLARRIICVSCRGPKNQPARQNPTPEAVDMTPRPSQETPALPQQSSWKCSSCGNSNLAKRHVCVTCRAARQGNLSDQNDKVRKSRSRWDELLGPKDQVDKLQPKEGDLLGQNGKTQSTEAIMGKPPLQIHQTPEPQPDWGGFPRQKNQVQTPRSDGGDFLGQRAPTQNSKPIFGRSVARKDHVQQSRTDWVGMQGQKDEVRTLQRQLTSQSESFRMEPSTDGGQRQRPIDTGLPILAANREQPQWQRQSDNSSTSRKAAFSNRDEESTSLFAFRSRLSQSGQSRDPGRGTEYSIREVESAENLRKLGNLSLGGAPSTSAQQVSQVRGTRAEVGRNMDTGDRSGLEALLSLSSETEKRSSRLPKSIGTEPPRRRPRTSDFAGGGNVANHSSHPTAPSHNLDDILPELPVTVAERFLGEGADDMFRDRKARQKSRFEESEEDTRRARGRFQADLEEPQVAETKVELRQRRKPARQSSSRESSYDMKDPDEELLLESRGRKKKKSKANSAHTTPDRIPIQLPEFISVENLATALRVRTEDFIDRMQEMGFDRPRLDHILDAETSGLIANEFNFEPNYGEDSRVQDLVARPIPEDVSSLPPRPPIVTIMGHVDHGKTTILDWLRKSSVVESEHGGITQHIGAFSVTMPGGKQITFLDTPGHAAFLDMRRRGANVTDIVILVVAADDSVKPQTLEAIKHATDAKVPLIVAINKVDKEDANVDRVKQDLARHGVTVEDYGGEVQAIPVSGKFGKGMAELEEATVTLSELLDHRAEVDGPVEGWIIESKVTLAGRVATVLVRRGTLRPGDIIVAGNTWARIRTLRNDAGALVDEAPPGTPVQIDGWRGDDPIAGWEVLQAEDEDHAKDVVELRQERKEYTKLADDTAAINATRAEEAEARAKTLQWEAEQEWASKRANRRPKDNAGWVEGKASGGPKQVHFVVKADVSGSVEAVVNSVSAIGNNEVAANVIRSAVGEINESDVQHLASSGEVGYLISFNQPVDPNVARLAEAAGLQILDYNIIYKVTDVVKEKLTAELPPLITQKVVGEAEIGKIFEISVKKGKTKIAGCRISNGVISREKKVRVLRGSRVLYIGTLNSLKNVKKDVTEMRKGTECGIGFENWQDFHEGDQVQCYEEHKTARTL